MYDVSGSSKVFCGQFNNCFSVIYVAKDFRVDDST